MKRRIACLTLLPGAQAASGRCKLPDGEIEWDTFHTSPELGEIHTRIQELLKKYDAVAIEGLTASFKLGKEVYRHEHVWRRLELEKHQAHVSDGSGLQSTLERFLIRQAAEQLKAQITGRRILFFSGLNRYGAAEVLSAYSNRMLFGDMLYGLRLGIPIFRFDGFVSQARNLARAVSSTPANWFWPSTKRNKPVWSRYHRYFRACHVIVGELSYFKRYMPATLPGKIIFTTMRGDGDIDMFAARGARYLVSLTPVLDGVYVPLPVLEAGLRLGAGKRKTVDIEDYYLGQLQAMDIRPHIIDLAREGHEDYALIEVPERPYELTPALPPDVEPELSRAGDVHRFCFVIHPLSFKFIERLKVVRILRYFLPKRWIENLLATVKPWRAGLVRNVVSAKGAKAEGLLYAIPMTSQAMMRFKPAFLYKRLQFIAEDAARQGCQLMGLGAYTSVVGDAGLTVSRTAPLGVTTGNSFTVAATLLTLEETAFKCGIDISRSSLLIVGATGSIGSICARLTAARVKHLYLVSPRPEKLLELARLIEHECPQIKGHIELSRHAGDFTHLADGIITTTSSVEPVVDIKELKPGCLVLDVARPPDITAAAAAQRDDVLVIESGEVLLPDGAEVTMDIGLPHGVIYACLAETLLLALDGRMGHFTLGRDIDPDRVNLITEIAKRHGMELAPTRSFGQPVSDSHFKRMHGINAPRYLTTSTQPSE